jgi:protein-S-isoprenylcysteine O-methyltransferase Ste14
MRIAILAWGLFSYLLFFGCFLYAIAFVGDFGVVPKTIDSGPAGPVGPALAANLALLALFALQHTGMARPGFKRVWTRVVPEPAERATYVLLSSLALVALFVLWRPIPGLVWEVTQPWAAGAIQALYFGGWALLLYATLLLDHFDLFGLRQSWAAFRGRRCEPLPFATPGLYARVRHPIYLAWATIFWATPTMSQGHLFFAVVTTVYMGLAAFVEERDLVAHFGDAYRRYQQTTPKHVPLPRFLRQSPSRKSRIARMSSGPDESSAIGQ